MQTTGFILGLKTGSALPYLCASSRIVSWTWKWLKGSKVFPASLYKSSFFARSALQSEQQCPPALSLRAVSSRFFYTKKEKYKVVKTLFQSCSRFKHGENKTREQKEDVHISAERCLLLNHKLVIGGWIQVTKQPGEKKAMKAIFSHFFNKDCLEFIVIY